MKQTNDGPGQADARHLAPVGLSLDPRAVV